jgi:hypothetical protein
MRTRAIVMPQRAYDAWLAAATAKVRRDRAQAAAPDAGGAAAPAAGAAADSEEG